MLRVLRSAGKERTRRPVVCLTNQVISAGREGDRSVRLRWRACEQLHLSWRPSAVVNAVTGRGRHTSTSAVALALPGGGWVVDTPGIRSFGLAHVDASRLIGAFPDLDAGTAECPRGCTHDEPDCGLDAWVAAGHETPERLTSLRRLLRSMRQAD